MAARRSVWRRLFRLGKWGAAITVILAAAWQISETDQAGSDIYGGTPKSHWSDTVRVLRSPGFVTGYSELRRSALWTAFKVRPVRSKQHLPRPGGFSTDYRTFWRVESEDYSRTGYQRGHLAPNFAMAQLYGRDAQLASFRMSNVLPQRAGVNQGVWQRLEEIEVDDWARRLGTLQVLAGPVYWGKRERLRSGLEIPDAFYRILVDIDSRRPQAIAFLVPQTVRGKEPLTAFLTTVDELEARTRLDFLEHLADNEEARVEAGKPDGRWQLPSVAFKQGRYNIN